MSLEEVSKDMVEKDLAASQEPNPAVEAVPVATVGRPFGGWSALAKWGGGGLAVLALAVYPTLSNGDNFGITLLTEVLIYALFALSLNVLLGFTGLVSFGHAAYFGLGVYAAGVFTVQLKNSSFLLGLLVGVVVAGLAAVGLGFLSIRTSGIYFLVLTLAFSQMLYALAFKWNDLTGGSNGLPVLKPELILFGWQINLTDPVAYYFVTLVLFVIGFLIVRQVVRSPFGHTLVGIRDNEERMAALGYQTRNFKLAAFVIAGALAGLAGGLNVYHNGFASADDLYWTNSGLVMVMVLLGGKGTLIGPVLGAFFVRYTEQFIQGQNLTFGTFIMSERWLMVLGAILVIFVLFAPSGIVGIGRSMWQYGTDRLNARRKQA